MHQIVSPSRFTPRSSRDKGGGDGFTLPPALAKLPPGRNRLPREFIEQNQRNRILLAGVSVFGRKGLAGATVQDLTREALVSRATFYKYFSDKAACLRAVHSEVFAWLEEEVRAAASAAPDWPGAVRAVSARVIQLLADDPRLARLCAIESHLAGPEVQARYDEAMAELAAALGRGRSERPWGEELPQSFEPLLIAGAVTLTARTVTYRPRSAVKALAGELPEILLIPYLGVEDARRAVRGSD
jgi:AcrR family transcriptional regulator